MSTPPPPSVPAGHYANHGPQPGHPYAPLAGDPTSSSVGMWPDERKAITQRQMNYAVAASGALAKKEAEAQGIDPDALDALCQEPVQIGPFEIQPISIQVLNALRLVQQRREERNLSGGQTGNETGAAEDFFAEAEAVLVFAQPLQCLRLLRTGSGERWVDFVDEESAKLTPRVLREITAHITAQMAVMSRLSGEASAPFPPAQPSPAETPQAAS